METGLFNRVQATLLALVTAGLFVLAVLNFLEERNYPQPDDGVWWREASGGLTAERVLPGMSGQVAGIQPNDLLTGVANCPSCDTDSVSRLSDLERALYRTGPYGQVYYSITRDGIPLDTPVKVIPLPLDRSLAQGLRIIGLIYLIIGFYVLFRRWGAPRATHFYLFCLVSFAWYALKYTGRLDGLDWTVFWANTLAEALQPALFLHFALSFPEERFKRLRRSWLLPLIYAPGAGLLGLWLWAIETRLATGLLKHRLDQTATAYDAAFYILAALLFLRSYAQADTPVLRQQLKWLYRGTFGAVLPFTLFYAVPFLFDLNPPQLLTNLAGLSLVLLPLTFSWAIVRYRLMDTDLIFKRGVAYTLATGLILGGYFGTVALVTLMVHNSVPQAVREWAFPIAMMVALAVFDPLKRRIQGWVDRAFDRHRYDYRKALVEFGRGLSSETDLQALLNSIVEQLPRTLLVARVAIFLARGPEDSGLRLAASHGLPTDVSAAQHTFDLGFLNLGFQDFAQANPHSHIFLENAQQAFHLPLDQQRAAAMLDLNYYLPCRVATGQIEGTPAASRTIAVIGLGRTMGGDFLSSEDVELLESLASYIGIALQNASLYARLEMKIGEFERLKEFNENIVESINVGILALDLEDRIESWNAQMEAMYALSRAEALGQRVQDVFPLSLSRPLTSFATSRAYTISTSSASPRAPANCALPTSPSRPCSPATSSPSDASSSSMTSPSASLLKPSSPRLTSSVPSACSLPASRTKSIRHWPSSPPTRRCSPSSCAAMPASVRCSTKSPSRASVPPKSPTACSTSPAPRPLSSAPLISTRSSATLFRCSSISSRLRKSTLNSTYPVNCPPSTAIPESCSRSFSTSCSTPKKPCPAAVACALPHLSTDTSKPLSPILAPASRPNISSAFTIPSSPPKPRPNRATAAERVSAFPSLTESFRNMPEKFMSRAPSAPALPFISSFRY